jgi:probable phosphoglycerate mutase
MIRLALMRHGHTQWNREGRIQGRTDIPLDPEAEKHLSALRLPTPWQSADLVSSPLTRAIDTARLVGQRAPVPVPALVEMNWGDWEGKKGAELLAQPGSGYLHIEDWGWDYRPPNGESPKAVHHRVMHWANALSRDTVAVCHIGIMRVLLAQATGWDFSGPAPFRIKRDRLFVLTCAQGRWHADDTPVRLEAAAL